MVEQSLLYYLTEHPSIVGFRWSHSQSWGNTWPFLLASVAAYVLFSAGLHLLLRRPLPLGPLPALHSLAMALASATIFAGLLLSAAAEIRDTRWLWRRAGLRTPLQWLLCFPPGTRPTGRVFFWSYAFYVSRFAHALGTVLNVARRRRLPFYQLFNNSMLIVVAFLWLEFSQSFQVLAILLTTAIYSLVYGYRFWIAIGLRRACFPFVVSCQILLLACNLVCHFGVLLLHLIKGGGCNGIGAWLFNSLLNAAILFFFLNFHVRRHLGRKKTGAQVLLKNKDI